MRRNLQVLIIATLAIVSIPSRALAATSAHYVDITRTYLWAKQDIIALTDAGVIHGVTPQEYQPGAPLTRGQLIAYFWNLIHPGKKPVATMQLYFDVKPDDWAFNYVGAAYNEGWIKSAWLGATPGYTFRANAPASFGDAASLLVAYLLATTSGFTTAGRSPLAWAKAQGLFVGIPQEPPSVSMNRADAAVFLKTAEAYVIVTPEQTTGTATITATARSVSTTLNVTVTAIDTH